LILALLLVLSCICAFPVGAATSQKTEKEINGELSTKSKWTLGGWKMKESDGGYYFTGASGKLSYNGTLPNSVGGMQLEFDVTFPDAEGSNTLVLSFYFGNVWQHIRIRAVDMDGANGGFHMEFQTNDGDWHDYGDGANFSQSGYCESNKWHVTLRCEKGSGRLEYTVTDSEKCLFNINVNEDSAPYLPDGLYSRDLSGLSFGGSEMVSGKPVTVSGIEFSYAEPFPEIKAAESWDINASEGWSLDSGVLSSGLKGSRVSLNGAHTVNGLYLAFSVEFSEKPGNQSISLSFSLGDTVFVCKTRAMASGDQLQIREIYLSSQIENEPGEEHLPLEKRSAAILAEEFKISYEFFITATGYLKMRAFIGDSSENTTKYESLFIAEWKESEMPDFTEGIWGNGKLSSLYFEVEEQALGWKISGLKLGSCLEIAPEPEVSVVKPTVIITDDLDSMTKPAITTLPTTDKTVADTTAPNLDTNKADNNGTALLIAAAVLTAALAAAVSIVLIKRKRG